MVLHTKHYSLILDKNRCTGCGICMEICPKEAIEVRKALNTEEKKASPPSLRIIKEKCHYCGMCEAICPFGALKTEVNGKHLIPVVENESFPQLIREIKVDENNCKPEILEIEEICPLGCIDLSVQYPNEAEKIDSISKIKKGIIKVKILIEKNSCPCCGICETKLPKGVINVKKMIYGKIRINNEKCPKNCHICVDVCPIPNVLARSNGKIEVNETHCVYCGACKISCPEEEALELIRNRIHHSKIHSGAWNKALEKLTSTKAVMKELRKKNAEKLKKVITKRWPQELGNGA
jgi:NAD-dependent dihydropyrimidine dehydrogenase PreA subunit